MNVEAVKADIRKYLFWYGELLKEGRKGFERDLANRAVMRRDHDKLASDARTDPIALGACAHYIERYIKTGRPVPDSLLLLALDVMRGKVNPRRPGRTKVDNFNRNLAIVDMARIAVGHGLPKYTGSSYDISACSLIAECLEEYGTCQDSCRLYHAVF